MLLRIFALKQDYPICQLYITYVVQRLLLYLSCCFLSSKKAKGNSPFTMCHKTVFFCSAFHRPVGHAGDEVAVEDQVTQHHRDQRNRRAGQHQVPGRRRFAGALQADDADHQRHALGL